MEIVLPYVADCSIMSLSLDSIYLPPIAGEMYLTTT